MSAGVQYSPEQELLSNQLHVAFGSISAVCGLLQLKLMRDMWREKKLKTNGFVRIIFVLAISELFYDIAEIIERITKVSPSSTSFSSNVKIGLTVCGSAIKVFSGSFGTLCTNVMIIIAVYVVKTYRFFDMAKRGSLVFFLLMALSLATTLISLFVYVVSYDSVYEYLRVASILFNLVALAYIAYVFTQRGIFTWQACFCCCIRLLPEHFNCHRDNDERKRKIYRPDLTNSPLGALVSRMSYYPVVQVLTRFPSAWLTFGYALTHKSTQYDRNFVFVNVLDAVLAPSGGIGFFITFLVLQPDASSHFARMMWCGNRCDNSENKNTQSKDEDEDEEGEAKQVEGETRNSNAKETSSQSIYSHLDEESLAELVFERMSACQARGGKEDYGDRETGSEFGDHDPQNTQAGTTARTTANATSTAINGQVQMNPIIVL